VRVAKLAEMGFNSQTYPNKGNYIFDSARFEGMISIKKTLESNNAGRHWAEWAAQFSGKIFVSIVAYLDESGTHDESAKMLGSEVPIIAGYMATREQWGEFCQDWQKALDDDTVSYFHYRVFNARDERKTNSKSPYYGWDDERAAKFEFKLAEIAGRQIPLIGHYNLKGHKAKFEWDKTYSYEYVMKVFFQKMLAKVSEHYPHLNEKIAFIMDLNQDKRWGNALYAVAEHYRKQDGRIGGVHFDEGYVEKKRRPLLPLQAADMIAYRSRRLATKFYENNEKQFADILNIMLMRNLKPDRKWRPSISQEQFRSVYDLTEVHPPVKKALSENSAIHFRLLNEKRAREQRNTI
jgi:hypothetical protein